MNTITKSKQTVYMIEFLTQPLTYAFMQRGLLAGTMVGILCAVMGTYVVLRGMAFLGDALAHAIMPGIALAYLLGGNLLIGALVAAAAGRGRLPTRAFPAAVAELRR